MEGNKGRTIALVVLFAVLIGVVAYVYWPEAKAKPEDLGPQPGDPVQPRKPGDPPPEPEPPPPPPMPPGTMSG